MSKKFATVSIIAKEMTHTNLAIKSENYWKEVYGRIHVIILKIQKKKKPYFSSRLICEEQVGLVTENTCIISWFYHLLAVYQRRKCLL